MPSPIGHALGALAAGWLVAGRWGADRSSRAARASTSSETAVAEGGESRAGDGAPAAARRRLQRSCVAAGSGRLGAPTVWREAIWFVALGLVADVDLFFGWHSGPTHSLGAALIAGAVLMLVRRAGWLAIERPFLAGAAAYGSHPLLDWLGADSSPPYGVMAFWPFTAAYFIAPEPVLMAISRRYWLPGFLEHNLTAVAFEILLLGPVAVAVWALRRAPASGT